MNEEYAALASRIREELLELKRIADFLDSLAQAQGNREAEAQES